MLNTKKTAMLASVMATAALATALAVTPAEADTRWTGTPTAKTPAPAAMSVGCASLVSNTAGRATVKNICDYKVWVSVSVSWFDPTCIDVNPGRTRALTWDPGKGKAEYAYEC